MNENNNYKITYQDYENSITVTAYSEKHKLFHSAYVEAELRGGWSISSHISDGLVRDTLDEAVEEGIKLARRSLDRTIEANEELKKWKENTHYEITKDDKPIILKKETTFKCNQCKETSIEWEGVCDVCFNCGLDKANIEMLVKNKNNLSSYIDIYERGYALGYSQGRRYSSTKESFNKLTEESLKFEDLRGFLLYCHYQGFHRGYRNGLEDKDRFNPSDGVKQAIDLITNSC